MNSQSQLVVFRVDQQRYALPLHAVERIVRAAHVTRLPNAPENVVGVIDVEGRIIPVLNLRNRFQHEPVEISPDNQFLIAQTSQRSVILVIDEALGVIDTPDASTRKIDGVGGGQDQISGAFTLDDGLLLIQDLEKFLSVDEEVALDKALREGTSNAA
jgi:purine-binding chemotaxis protein CheW